MRALPLVLLLLACAEPETTAPDAAPAAEEEVLDAAAELEAQLVGTYDSSAQAKEDREFYDILLTMCPVELPELGERVLYVEQALHETPDEPYRQRFYALEAGDSENVAVSRIFEAERSRSLIGTCADPAALDVDADKITELAGCEVVLTWDGEAWTGGTIEDRCLNDYQGATYATSEIHLDDDALVSWDRGWTAEDEHIWGATSGGYIFDRTSELGSWRVD